jgi:hypothetical protein
MASGSDIAERHLRTSSSIRGISPAPSVATTDSIPTSASGTPGAHPRSWERQTGIPDLVGRWRRERLTG